MKAELTEAQSKVYNFIARTIHTNGIAPTIREIMAEFNFASTNAAVIHIRNLTRLGYLSVGQDRKARMIRLVDDMINGVPIGRTVTVDEVKQVVVDLKPKFNAVSYELIDTILRELSYTIID